MEMWGQKTKCKFAGMKHKFAELAIHVDMKTWNGKTVFNFFRAVPRNIKVFQYLILQ